jgi:CheY-like chemotaxis protein
MTRGTSAMAKTLLTDDASGALERRIAGVAHELRTPLNGLLALADKLLTTELDDEQRQYICAMRASAHHLYAVATDVLDVARLQESTPRLDCRIIDMNGLFAEIGAPFAARAAEASILFETEIAPEVPHRLVGDPVRLRQMVENLVDNAFKVTLRGRICLTVTAAPAALPDRTRLTVVVTDTGPGFDGSETETIFMPFTQGTHARGGAGLGLALVRGFAEAMNGSTFATNRPQGGAAVGFSIDLPKAPLPVVPADGREAVAPRRRGPLRILVAEDNPVNRVVISTILDQFGHNHDIVANGSAAVAAVARGDYDLVLMDKKMPVLDGLAATRAIRALASKSGTIPVIGLTAGVFDHEIAEFRAAGAEAVVTKPVSVRALWKAIDDALSPARRTA